jgi:hypothetical protein
MTEKGLRAFMDSRIWRRSVVSHAVIVLWQYIVVALS